MRPAAAVTEAVEVRGQRSAPGWQPATAAFAPGLARLRVDAPSEAQIPPKRPELSRPRSSSDYRAGVPPSRQSRRRCAPPEQGRASGTTAPRASWRLALPLILSSC
eukprot:scaffold3398_cov118-Isochrysis_galbana.AAC.2